MANLAGKSWNFLNSRFFTSVLVALAIAGLAKVADEVRTHRENAAIIRDGHLELQSRARRVWRIAANLSDSPGHPVTHETLSAVLNGESIGSVPRFKDVSVEGVILYMMDATDDELLRSALTKALACRIEIGSWTDFP